MGLWLKATARTILLALLAAGCAATTGAGGVQPTGSARTARLAATEADLLVAAHNRWRARVGVRPLRWSADLAAIAQAWADRLASRGCRLEHQRSSGLGENLFLAGPVRTPGGAPALAPVTPDGVVDAWGSEYSDYSYSRNSCARGRTCGHYTQVVWAESETMGCAVASCPSLAQIWVCEYHPAGNVQRRRPY